MNNVKWVIRMVISPIMIVWIALSSASALGLYRYAAFLIVQTQVANMYYSKLAKKKWQLMIEAMEKQNQLVSKTHK